MYTPTVVHVLRSWFVSSSTHVPTKNATLPATGERSTGEEDVAAAMKTHTQPLPPGSTAPASLNPAEVVAMDMLLSRQLVEGLISLLINVPVS